MMAAIATATLAKSLACLESGWLSSEIRSIVDSMAELMYSTKTISSKERIRIRRSIRVIGSSTATPVSRKQAAETCRMAESWRRAYRIPSDWCRTALSRRRTPLLRHFVIIVSGIEFILSNECMPHNLRANLANAVYIWHIKPSRMACMLA